MKQAKRTIYLRVAAGLLGLWLAFFGAFSVWQLMRQRDAGLKEYMALLDASTAEIASYYEYYTDVYSQRNPDTMTLPAEPEWVVGALATRELQMVRNTNEMELACYDSNGDLLAQTGPYLCMRYDLESKIKGHSQPETHFALLDIYSALPEDAADKLAYYASYLDLDAYESGKTPEAGRVVSYWLCFPGGGWSDGQYVIPRKIVVFPQQIMYEGQDSFTSPQFDEQGNLIDEEDNPSAVWTYAVEPTAEQLEGMVEVENINTHILERHFAIDTEYPQHKARTLDEIWSRMAKGRAGNEEWGYAGGFLVDSPGRTFMSAKGLLTTDYIAEGDDYHGNILLVAAGTYHTLQKSLKTLAAAAAGSGALMLVVGLILCWQLGKVYQAQAELEASRRRTTNAIAHDLKTPMAAVMAYAENLMEDVQPQKRDHYIAAIHTQTARMDAIVRSMLELSRLEAGVDRLQREEFSLGTLCRQAAEEQPGDHLVLVSGDATVCADREMLRRVLDNLLSNAQKHAAPGSAISVTIGPDRLEVFNQGQQIPEEQMKRLWEAYYQADEARSTGGSGLGLSIVREILQRHGWTYGAENRQEGVCFWLGWPESRTL